MRAYIVAGLLVLAACGGGGGGDKPQDAERQFLDKWPEIPAGPDIDGHPTRVDEEQRVVYVADCEIAERETTKTGGRFGPTERDPETQAYELGYAHVCSSAG